MSVYRSLDKRVAPAGSVGISSLIVVALSARAASVGPSPSCRSRRRPPALLLARRHQPLARALQIGGELDRVRGDADLSGQILQQPPVRGGERLSPLARPQRQLANGLRLIDQWQCQRRFHGRAVDRLGTQLVASLERDGGVGQLERLRDRLDDRRQQRLGR